MSLKSGISTIQSYLKTLPAKPGIYHFLDKEQNILYIGKAKNLPKRVASYTTPKRLPYRLQRMISQTKSLDITITNTEEEALLLEANLIKKHEPRYNILLKDDKSYPYILIETESDFPRISKHRGAQKVKGHYFGPFSSAGAVNKVIIDLQKAFLVRPCTDSFFKNRTQPCIEYQIKRCSGPCANKISKQDYAHLVSQATDFLKGKSKSVQQQLEKSMKAASYNLQYEQAATLRDRIKALNIIQTKQLIHIPSIKNADIIATYQDKNKCCIQLFFFRNGLNYGNKAFFPKNTEGLEEADIIDAFISQFYQNQQAPKELITSHLPTNKALLERAHSTKISCPQKGKKKNLIKTVIKNAKESLIQKTTRSLRHSEMMNSIKEIFNLPKAPKRIEVYDNSHISGTNQVGAMITTDRDGFNKKAYRLFNIKSKTRGDDYAMLKEVLTRRFSRLLKEDPNRLKKTWPDFIMIDGGKGHLSITKQVLQELDIEKYVSYCAIAKGPNRNAGREQFHFPQKPPFSFPKNDPVLYYLQNLRDEAHRFAIESHRKKRKKSIRHSILDDIKGIGPTHKKSLLKTFGSVAKVKQASLKDLTKTTNKTIAKEIHNHLHQ